ncbi:PRC-barrel domain-containing protein [Methanobacterium sp. ACI-7]|uniref:PRC-barrel domain-containing protein n=1 Tax=unclassified Methanobacterium TaxID=2627676 RepID=UPI0039C22F9A
MNAKDLEGKDIIDAEGNKVGEVDGIEIDTNKNTVVGIIANDASISAKLGMGESRIIPVDKIQALGEKVLLKRMERQM